MSTAPTEAPIIEAPANAQVEAARFHHLDAMRAFALLLGVFFHAAESFGPDNRYWAIVDSSSTRFLEMLRFPAHSFRLELFFVIAGFFARMLIQKRGVRGFAANRFVRIAIPLVAGWFVLYPILVFIWIWGRTVSGDFADLQIPPEAQGLPAWKLWLGFFLTLGFLKTFDLTHLWFLHQLLIICVIYGAAYGVFSGTKVVHRTMTALERAFVRAATSRMAILWFALASVPLLLTMDSWGVDTPKESLWPHIPTTLLFGFCFGAGWLWHRRSETIGVLPRTWVLNMALAVACCVALLFFSHFTRGLKLERWMVRLLYTILYAHMMWGLVLGFMGLFTRYGQQPSPWTRYISDSSYWVYIVHLPVVVALQVAIAKAQFPWPLKFLGIAAATLLVCFLTYHFLVRATWIGKLLNGRRYPRQWPWQGDGRGQQASGGYGGRCS